MDAETLLLRLRAARQLVSMPVQPLWVAKHRSSQIMDSSNGANIIFTGRKTNFNGNIMLRLKRRLQEAC